MDKWQALLASGEPGEIEVRRRRFDGEFRRFLFTGSPLRDKTALLLAHDIGIRVYGIDYQVDQSSPEESLVNDDRCPCSR
jgi:hypothetical protein